MKTVNMKIVKEKTTFIKVMLMLLISMTSVMSACSDDDDDKIKAPAAPVLNNATAVTANSFTATWAAVPRADKYYLDVSVNQNFATTLAGYDNKEIAGLTTVVNGLTTATIYYFRLYAADGTLLSEASASKQVTTL